MIQFAPRRLAGLEFSSAPNAIGPQKNLSKKRQSAEKRGPLFGCKRNESEGQQPDSRGIGLMAIRSAMSSSGPPAIAVKQRLLSQINPRFQYEPVVGSRSVLVLLSNFFFRNHYDH
jgi:hypothetical protein